MAVTYPRLTIVDATWTTTHGPWFIDWVTRTDMLAASVDPLAASWYTSKFMLTPVARFPDETNPDPPGYYYKLKFQRWANFLIDSAGLPVTRDSSMISVYNREILGYEDICGDANGDRTIDVGDAVRIINYVFKDGAAPEPLCIGDANHDDLVNIGDAVYLVNYIFRDGQEPTPDCCR
jgi:hypothetical protein